MGANHPDANISNIDKVVGNWLIHCKYKKATKTDGSLAELSTAEEEVKIDQVNIS